MFSRLAAILTIAIAASVTLSGPAAAADFDSAFAGESAFLSLTSGQSGTFTVFFLNTGTATWVKGTATQVDLAACLDDQIHCDLQDATEAAFNPGTWRTAGRYAAHTQSTVAPGAIATFSYDVKVPSGAVPGRRRFNGDLIVSVTGQRIHPEGYYQDLTVRAPSCTPSFIRATPAAAQVRIGTDHTQSVTVLCGDGVTNAADVPITVVAKAGADFPGSPADAVRTANSDANGVATVTWKRTDPGSELATAYVTTSTSVVVTVPVRWYVPDAVLTCTPTDSATQTAGTQRSFTVTAKDPKTGAVLTDRALDLTVVTYISSGTAKVSGVSALAVLSGTGFTTVKTDSKGSASFLVSGTSASVQPRVFLDENGTHAIETNEFQADCGNTSFANP